MLTTLLTVTAAAGAALLLYLADRLLLKMEDRGWIYYRKKHGTTDRIGEAALRLQALLEPTKQYVLEEKKRDVTEEGRSGAPPDGATPGRALTGEGGGAQPPCGREPSGEDEPMGLDEARTFAYSAHAGQLYGTLPYSAHLDAVTELVAPFGERAQALAYLHDVVDDTGVSAEVIRERFGPHVAECMALLTDVPGPNRKERKAKTYAKLAKVSGPAELALVIKAADRLANVRACLADGKQAMWRMSPSSWRSCNREGFGGRLQLMDPARTPAREALHDAEGGRRVARCGTRMPWGNHP